jgi:ProP effector
MNTTTAAESVESVESVATAESAETTPATPENAQGADTPADDASAPAAADAAAAPAPAAPAAGAQPTSARALLKQLQQEFPAFRDCLPLAIGIDKQLLARMPGLDRKTMRAALGIHTGSMRYLRAMEKAKVRHDLDGTAGAEVTDTHRLHAKEQLQQRFKKEADRKKAEREAAAEEEANRQRQEKLKALASKFSRN